MELVQVLSWIYSLLWLFQPHPCLSGIQAGPKQAQPGFGSPGANVSPQRAHSHSAPGGSWGMVWDVRGVLSYQSLFDFWSSLAAEQRRCPGFGEDVETQG